MRFRSILLSAACGLAFVTSAGAQVTGKVTLDGKAPEAKEIDMSAIKECASQHPDPPLDETIVAGEKGELANVVVSIKADDPSLLGGEVPKEPAVIDQKGCMYIPHVLDMTVGQELVIRNDDPFLHNVHSLAQVNPGFNFGQPNKDTGKKVDPPKAAETFKVKCDVHPWMNAWIVVVDHPFHATTKTDGTFSIAGLPDGDYDITAWHEKLGPQAGKVSVKGGKGEVTFTFKAPAADATPTDAPKYASTSGQMSCCGECGKSETGDKKQ